MVPGAEKGFYGGMHMFQEPANAIAIAVEKAADHERGDLVIGVLIGGDRSALPKGAITLLVKIQKKPGSGVETSGERFFIGGKIRRACHANLHIHAKFEFIDVHEAVNVMNVVVEKIFGGTHGDDCFERRGMQMGHLNGVESAPGNSHHADVAVGPWLLRKPIDYFEAVFLFLIGVFAVGRIAFACAGAADVHARGYVAASHEIGMQLPVAGQGPVVFAIGQVFEDGWKLPFVVCAFEWAIRHVEIYCKVDAVFHRNPRLNCFYPCVGWRRGFLWVLRWSLRE